MIKTGTSCKKVSRKRLRFSPPFPDLPAPFPDTQEIDDLGQGRKVRVLGSLVLEDRPHLRGIQRTIVDLQIIDQAPEVICAICLASD